MSEHKLNVDGEEITVTVVEFVPRKRPTRYDDPELYEVREYGGIKSMEATQKRAEQLRDLWAEHIKHEDQEKWGWKGPCFAVVPSDVASHMSEAMCFMGAVVDLEEPGEDGNVRLWSEGYYIHIGA